MAAIHVARLNLMRRSAEGKLYNANSSRSTDGSVVTIRDAMTMSTEVRVAADGTIPNSLGYPDVKTYLEAEAAAGFLFVHMDQTYLITQNPS